MKLQDLKPQYWLPVVVFLGTSVPAVLLLQTLDWGGEYRLWIAIVFGGVLTAYAQSRLAAKQSQKSEGGQ